MTDEWDALLESKLASMGEAEFDALAARVRPPAELTPKERAVAAVRKELGVTQRGRGSKAKAADAVRNYRAGQ